MSHICVLNGPNLNLLGTREPDVYGQKTLADIEQGLNKLAVKTNTKLTFKQSNAEHELVESIQAGLKHSVDYFIINAGAFTHTSVAIRDALSGVEIPFIEVHISNVYARESFRHHSYLSDISQGVIVGLGTQGYTLALQAALENLK